MGHDYWGNLYDESRRGTTLAEPSATERRKVVRDGDWNDYIIRCQGRRVQIWLNGQRTADYTEPDESLPQAGIIGLQIHGSSASEAWYKGIAVRPLLKE